MESAPLVEALTPPAARLTQIDGLRAIAALSVVGFHYTTRFDQLFLHASPTVIDFRYGSLGVSLFFAISGFVIHMTLDRIQMPLDFVVSRFSRLFPTYWAAIAVTWTLVTIAGLPGYAVSWKAAVFNLTMLQGFFAVPDVDGVYWSLQVELLFYIWMLVFWVSGAMRGSANVCITWLLIALAALVSEKYLAFSMPSALAEFLLLASIPWFSIGMVTYLTRKQNAFTARHIFTLLLAWVVIAMRCHTEEIVAAPIVFFLLFSASGGYMRWLALRPLVYFGVISYPLYLVHEKIGWLIVLNGEKLFAWPWISIAVAFLCSTTLAILLHNLVEQPSSKAILNYHNKFKAVRRSIQFSRPLWVIGGLSAIFIFTSAYVVTGRMHKAMELPRFVLTLNPTDVGRQQPCAAFAAAEHTSLVIVIGQSDAGSVSPSPHAASKTHVFHDGVCSEASEPLPGVTGSGESIWSATAAQFSKLTPSENMVLAPLEVGDARIADWLAEGALKEKFKQLLNDAKQTNIPVAAVLWQQGESDALAGTPALKYRDDLLRLRELIDDAGISAPLVLAKSTFCDASPYGPIRRAIDAAASENKNILIGPDTDQLGTAFREKRCRLNAAGRLTAATLWANYLAALFQRRQPATASDDSATQ